MKLLILDIDGVLNSSRTHIAFDDKEIKGTEGSLVFSTDPRYGNIPFTQEYFKLDPVAIAILRKIIEHTGAKIVISSSWRIGSCIEHFNKMFECYGWDTKDIIIDFTPVLGKLRGEEVKMWLLNYMDNDSNEAISKYAIIDDNEDFLPEQKSNFIHTNKHVGLSHVSYNMAIDILGFITQP